MNQKEVIKLAEKFTSGMDFFTFCEEILGLRWEGEWECAGEMKVGGSLRDHTGQVNWIENSTHTINVLKPANRWGKSLITACKHIYHCVTKLQIRDKVKTLVEWRKVRYTTLNFGPTYEVAKEVGELVQDIVEGQLLLPDGTTNNSLLAGWAIKSVKGFSSSNLPQIIWFNNAHTLIRSIDEMGRSFKMKKLAYCSGDECGDVSDLWMIVCNTLLPRLIDMGGPLDLIGTPQPGTSQKDYKLIVEMAKEAMALVSKGVRSDMGGLPTADWFYYEGSVYENPFLDINFIRKIESTLDEKLKRQVIYGEFVDLGYKYFTWKEVDNAFIEGLEGYTAVNRQGIYVTAADFSVARDRTEVGVFRIDLDPIIMCKYVQFVGKEVPMEQQYDIFVGFCREYNTYGNNHAIYDAQGMGGNIAHQQIQKRGVYGHPFGLAGNQRIMKMEALGALKQALSHGRLVESNKYGKNIDMVDKWGFLKLPFKSDNPNHKMFEDLREQLEGYQIDDKRIRQDGVMMLAYAMWYVEKYCAATARTKAVDFNIMAMDIPGRALPSFQSEYIKNQGGRAVTI